MFFHDELPIQKKRAVFLSRKAARFFFRSGGRIRLFSQAKLFDDLTITFDIHPFEVLQQTAAFTDEFDQRALRTEVVNVLLQMFGQVVDTIGEKSDLPFGRTRVSSRCAVLSENFLFFFFGQIHANIVLMIVMYDVYIRGQRYG